MNTQVRAVILGAAGFEITGRYRFPVGHECSPAAGLTGYDPGATAAAANAAMDGNSQSGVTGTGGRGVAPQPPR